MTTTAAAQSAPTHRDRHSQRLRLSGLLRSEWIKLRSIRSTWWCFCLAIAATAGFSLLLGLTFSSARAGAMPAAAEHGLQVSVATLGLNFTQLIIAVLGVLVISGEYGTGMIRSTLVVDPRRLGSFFAKATVMALSTFAVGALAIAASAALSWPLLAAHGIAASPLAWPVMLPLLGGAAYLALVALLAMCVGFIVRNSAAGIATVIGLLLVLPSVLNIVASLARAVWLHNLAAFLPSDAGARMFAWDAIHTVQANGALTLSGGEGALVMIGWVVLAGLVGIALLRRRDA